ncbi:MAG: hypothetical protein ACK4MM_03570, partial [Fervidobacterium sp.]
MVYKDHRMNVLKNEEENEKGVVRIIPNITPDKNDNNIRNERQGDNNNEKKFIKFLNRMYKLSQNGELTRRRIKLEQLQKVAILVFLTSILIITTLFLYMFFLSPESIFAKKSPGANYEINQKISETSERNETKDKSESLLTNSKYLQKSERSENSEDSEDSKDINNKPFEEKIGPLNETTNTEQNIQKDEKNQDVHNINVEPILEKEEIPTKDSKHLLSLKELAFISYGGASLLGSIEEKDEIGKLKYGSFVKVLQKIETDGVSYSKIVYFGKELNSEIKIGWTKTVNLSFIEKLLRTSEEVVLKDLKKIQGRVQKVRGIYISRHTASVKSNLDKFTDFANR